MYMKQYDEFKTPKGIGTCIGAVSHYIASVHLSSDEDGGARNSLYGNIDVLFANAEDPDHMIGFVPLDRVVDGAVSEGFEATTGFKLSADECQLVEKGAWEILTRKYGIFPEELITEPGE